MTSAKYITTETLADVLKLPVGASDTDILDRILENREAAGDEVQDSSGEAVLIRRGEHERVKLNEGGGATVTLLKPIKFGAETITELTLREPTARDLMRQTGKNSTARTVELIAETSGRTVRELETLKVVDLKTLSRTIDFLSGDGQ